MATIPAPRFDAGFSEDITPQVLQAAAPGAGAGSGFSEAFDPAEQQSYVAGLLRSLVGQGVGFGWGDEAMGALRSLLGNDTYAKAVADERAKVAAFRRQNPTTAAIAEVGGSFLTPGVGMIAGAARPAASLLGRMGQAAGYGGGLGALAGAGAAEEGNRAAGALTGAGLGAALAPAFPLVGSGVSSLARGAGNAAQAAAARMRPGEAGADIAMIRALRQAERTPADLRAQLAEADRVGQYHPAGVKAGEPLYSAVESPMALSDVPALRPLAGSVARSNSGARAEAETFYRARQTGAPPETPEAQAMLAGRGLYTRDPLGAAGMAEREPAGMLERVQDAVKRSFLLQDTAHHGHQPNTYLTRQAIIKEGRENANRLYGDMRTAAQGYDIRPHIQPAIDAVIARIRSPETGQTERRILQRFMREFVIGTGPNRQVISSMSALDEGKRALDTLIETAAQKGNRNIGRILRGDATNPGPLRQIMDAADGITHNNIGGLYKQARGQFATDAQANDAIEFGRNILTMDRNEAIARYGALGDHSEPLSKLARLGVVEAFESRGIDRARQDDLTRQFFTPRVQELLRNMIPRSEKASGAYADRPQRFGAFVRNERNMAETPRSVLGGSQTAERMADDAAFSRETLTSMVERFRGIPSVTNIAIEAASIGINRVFGYRDDVAQALARRLFTANRTTQEAILQRLEAQWGVDRVAGLVRGIEATALATGVGTATAVGRAAGEPRQLPAPRTMQPA